MNARKLKPLLSALALCALPSLAIADGWVRAPRSNGCEQLVSKLIDQQIASRPMTPREVDRGWLGRLSSGAEKPADFAPGMPSPATSDPRAERAMAEDAAPAAAARASAAAGKAGESKRDAGPRSYSRTNTQELEVDEGDIVKTDGRRIYHVSCSRAGEQAGCRNELRVYASWPAERTKLLARYALPTNAGSAIRQVYLSGDRLIAIADAGNTSTAIVLDVSDPSRPRPVRQVSIDGAFVDARMIGSKLILATRTNAPRLPPELAQEVHALITMAHEVQVQPTAAEIIERLDGRWSHFLSRDPGLPQVRELASSWGHAPARPAYACEDLAVAEAALGAQLTNVIQLDLTSDRIAGAGAAGTSQQSVVYASEGAFYVADAVRVPGGRGWQTASMIRKFDLSRAGRPSFEGEGVVRGTLINQFAMSEHGGHLRVATSDQWSSNNVYVLRASGRALETVGGLEGLAPNERIYSVRMMGDRGYVVTFRRTDPLYTLDLSNPERPTVVGELKVEGWSSYLHPLGDGHLLTVGQDADQAGRARGFHLQVFDVRDPRNPTRKFHHKLDGGSVSASEADHHAFLFEPQTMTLSVPYKTDGYFGLIAFKVDPSAGFVDLGRVNHASMYKQRFIAACERTPGSECSDPNYWYRFVARAAISVDRVIAIEDKLYSMSPAGMMIHRVGSKLVPVSSVLVAEPAFQPTLRPPPSLVRRW